jgi:NAD(P)-dependent dehydrogenase (short-subunit alcohol dehydrogenase family)
MPIQQHLNPYPRLDPTRLKNEFAGKSVLITGGGYGIGASIAHSFASAGISSIILAGRTESKLKSTADSLSSIFKNTKISIFKVDISSKTDVQNLFGSLKTSPNFLVNNAGFLATPENFVDADLDEYWSAFTTNVYGTVLVTQSFLRHRSTSTSTSISPAVIITLNSLGAYSQPFRPTGLSAHVAGKAALARWSEAVAYDVPASTARFISVHPGGVKTAMALKSGIKESGDFPFTDGELTGNFIAWAASEEAAFLAGRFVWVNWDVDQLVEAREEIVGKDLFKTSLRDFA